MEIIRVSETWQQALVFEIRKQVFIEAQNIPQEFEFDEIYGKTYNYILITENGKGVATARLNITNTSYGKIERVAVIPSFQNKGIGRKLIAACEKWLKDLEMTKSIITSQKQAVGFYINLNYKPDYSIKLVSDIPIVYLEKIL